MNEAEKKIDLATTKATELKYNRRIYAPKAAENKLETNLQQTKVALDETFRKFMNEKCGKKGKLRQSNETEVIKKGVKDLKGDGLVVMPTDKTGALSVETNESYKEAAKVHIKDDESVNEKVRKNTEAKFNGIAKAMVRFLRVGAANPADERITEAVTTSNTMLPPLSLFGKDHKPSVDPARGPKRRPVVSACEGPNVRVSNLVSKVLNKAADMEKSDTELKSSEDLQAKIEQLNTRLHHEAYCEDGQRDERCLVAGSLDFTAMYPSFEPKETAAIVRKRLETGPADIVVDDEELARTLAVVLTDEEVKDEDLEELVHSVKDGETKPKITDQEITGGEQFRKARSRLNPPRRKPNNQQRKKMVAIMFEWLVKFIMNNFLYTFGGENMKQGKGGPIGDEVTQAVSRFVGFEFDEVFDKKVKDAGIKMEMNGRYVDDNNVFTRSIGRKMKFCPLAGSLVEKTENEENESEGMREDEITMNELRKIADTCVGMLKTEEDSTSKHPELGNKVPILDMAVWVEQVSLPAPGLEGQDMGLHSRCEEGEECLSFGAEGVGVEGGLAGGGHAACRLVPQVLYEFYRKPMAPQRLLMAESAQPWQQKRTTWTQEVIRRMLRTRKQLSCQKKKLILSDCMQLMKNSGYQAKFRKEVLLAGLSGYGKILEADRAGTKPLYRSRDWRLSAPGLEDKKKRKAKRWLGGDYKSYIFVPHTPGSELRKLMQTKEEEMRPGGREKFHIKIIESAGNPLERMLVNVDPFEGNKCEDANCVVSKNPNNKINCRKNNVGYKIVCKLCLLAVEPESTEYDGETGKNMHCRCKEHVSKYNSKQVHIKQESTFIKHLINKHEEIDINTEKFENVYDVKVVKAYRKVMTRLVDEGTRIAGQQGESLNSKSEWHQPRIIRNVIVSGGAEMVAGRGGVVFLDGGDGGRGGAVRRGEAGVRGGEAAVRGGEAAVGGGEAAVRGVEAVRGGVGGVERAPEAGVASRTRSRRTIGQGGRVGGVS